MFAHCWNPFRRRIRIRLAKLLFGLLPALLLHALTVGGVAAEPAPEDLMALSLDELVGLEVTSVARKSQKLSTAAAAIFVISAEDIRRSGVTTIPEALRLAPGLEVARIDANKWAVSSRGFNGRFANKLLVLIDGRSVYTPLFSGVFWDVQDTLLEDIDRIEVIRGPGAALWGANAVNGVINIITRPAEDTQGFLAGAGAGDRERGFGALRYGGALGGDAHYRVYGKYFRRDSLATLSGEDGADDWAMLRGGFRIDWENRDHCFWTLQGEAYGGKDGERVSVPDLQSATLSRSFDAETDLAGGFLLSRFRHLASATSESAVQLYYDLTDRSTDGPFDETRHTFDIDFQHRFAAGERQELIWGGGYRLTADDFDNGFTVSFAPERRTDHLLSAFVQDDIALRPERLYLILGSKFEYSSYSGLEIQPNARLAWTPRDGHTLWAAVARAVRTPSRAEEDVRLNQAALPASTSPPSPPTLMAFFGRDDRDAEELLAFEAGYRLQPLKRLSLDLAAFYNVYDDLFTFERGAPFVESSPLPPHLVVPLLAANLMDGETYGAELAADWQAADWWMLRGAYTYLQMHLHSAGENLGPRTEAAEGDSPHHQASLRSAMDLPGETELDLWLRFVDDLPGQGVGGYLSLAARFGWRPRPNLELSLVGQNLLDPRHPEFKSEQFSSAVTEVERSVYGKVSWRF